MLFSSVLVPIVAIQDSEILMFWSDFGITMYYRGKYDCVSRLKDTNVSTNVQRM